MNPSKLRKWGSWSHGTMTVEQALQDMLRKLPEEVLAAVPHSAITISMAHRPKDTESVDEFSSWCITYESV